MHFRRSLIICLLTLLCPFLFAQSPATVKWSPSLETKSEGSVHQFLNVTPEHAHMLVIKGNPDIAATLETRVMKLDRDMNVVYNKPLPLKEGKVVHDLHAVVVFGEKIVIITSAFDKAADKTAIFMQVNNEHDMKLISARRELASGKGELYKKASTELSPDRSKLLVQTIIKPEAVMEVVLRVYDTELNESWSEHVDPKTIQSDGSVLMNDGTVAWLIGWRGEYKFFTQDARSIRSYDVDLPVAHMIDREVFLDAEHNIVATGIYKDPEEDIAVGSFFLRIDPSTGAVLNRSVESFDATTINSQGNNFKKAKKNTKVSYRKKEFIEAEDGGVYLLAEKVDTRSVYGSYAGPVRAGNFQKITHYTNEVNMHGEILVIKLDSNGNKEWEQVVPRHLESVVAERGSFGASAGNGKVHLMYNENKKNLELTPGEPVVPLLDLTVPLPIIVTLDGNGSFKRHVLFAPEDQKISFAAGSTVPLNDKDHLIYRVSRKGDYQFGRMSLKVE